MFSPSISHFQHFTLRYLTSQQVAYSAFLGGKDAINSIKEEPLTLACLIFEY